MENIWKHLFLCFLTLIIISVTPTKGQGENSVIVKEGQTAIVSFTIPDNEEARESSIIQIRVDPQNGTESSQFPSLLFVSLSSANVKVQSSYKERLENQLNGRTLTMTLKDVNENDAGYFGCFVGAAGSKVIKDCGQRLIVVREPAVPNIVATSADSPLVGGPLRLECRSRSNSLPPSHGLPLKVKWKNSRGVEFTTSDRFYVNDKSELQVDLLERRDKDVQFACNVADDVGDAMPENVWSETSPFYTVSPEYAPTKSDLKVTPNFNDGDKIVRKINDNLEYACEADCNPPCEVKWMYKSEVKGQKYGEVQGLKDPSVLIRENLSRYEPGAYRCRARNKHSADPARTTFKLQLLYIETPEMYMNDKAVSNLSVWEEEETTLKCVFDSNPRPQVVWRSPSGAELKTQQALGPELQTASSGVVEHLYTSDLVLDWLSCEDSGIYTCQGSTDIQVEGHMKLNVKCTPTPFDIPGKTLQDEYVWEIPYDLRVEFVMKGWPAPEISKIWSSLDGNRKPEAFGTDVHVQTTSPYDGKAWLTLFQITIRRTLTQEDAGRIFILEVFTADSTKEFEFEIRPRGPPHEVRNVTAENVRHDSVEVFWQPGFDGGEKQTFSVEYCKTEDVEKESPNWIVAAKDIPVPATGLWQTVKVTGLQARTEYTGRVVASNVLGRSTSEFSIKTKSAPSSGGLSAGAIVGIVFAVIIFLLIVAFLLYWFVYRKRYGKGGEDFSLAGMRDTLRALIKRDKDKPSQNGGVSSGSDQPKKNPIFKMKKLVTRIPKKLKKDYNTVPVKDEDDDDYFSDEFDDDPEYMNAEEETKPAKTDEILYANASAIRKNEEDKKKNEGREMNEEGLVYVSVDFPNSNLKPAQKNNNINNNNNKSSNGGNNKDNGTDNLVTPPEEDPVEYSLLDFSKTQTPLKDSVQQDVTAEMNPTLKHEEDKVNGAVDGGDTTTTAVSDDGDDAGAADGGADFSASVVPESKFGTAV